MSRGLFGWSDFCGCISYWKLSSWGVIKSNHFCSTVPVKLIKIVKQLVEFLCTEETAWRHRRFFVTGGSTVIRQKASYNFSLSKKCPCGKEFLTTISERTEVLNLMKYVAKFGLKTLAAGNVQSFKACYTFHFSINNTDRIKQFWFQNVFFLYFKN